MSNIKTKQQYKLLASFGSLEQALDGISKYFYSNDLTLVNQDFQPLWSVYRPAKLQTIAGFRVVIKAKRYRFEVEA